MIEAGNISSRSTSIWIKNVRNTNNYRKSTVYGDITEEGC